MRIAGKGRQATSLYRPIQLLYPLEVSQPSCEVPNSVDPRQATTPHDQVGNEEDTHLDNLEESEPLPQRMRRAAALEAGDRMMAQALCED